MLAATVLVTVCGPRKTVDMELPGEIPVSQIVPVLLEICASYEGDAEKWQEHFESLRVGGVALPLGKTLVEAGVGDGALLMLRTKDAPALQEDEFAPRQFAPRAMRPGVATGGIGVTWGEALV